MGTCDRRRCLGSTDVTAVSDAARSYLRLHLCSDVGPIRTRRLVEHFGHVDGVLRASMAELQRVEGIGPVIAKSIFQARGLDTVDREIERAAALGIRILCFEDADYPEPLRHIPDPPICLYVRGELRATDAVAVAIVGTRRCSHYGREQATRFGEILARAGFTIVSGLARGIDGYAHAGALRGQGRTIAVLGNGLPKIYPPEHESVADSIAAAGAIVSESPMDTQPVSENFPRRNRIIVGLSLGVVVVEAGLRSGALITARLANEYNRECFALPGRVDHPEQTAGVNKLIRDGEAKLVTCLEDVLDELGQVGSIMSRDARAKTATASSGPPAGAGGIAASRSAPRADVSLSNTTAEAFRRNLSDDERTILALLEGGASEPDEFAARSNLDISRVLATLTSLQLKGLVRQLPGSRFECRKPGSCATGD